MTDTELTAIVADMRNEAYVGKPFDPLKALALSRREIQQLPELHKRITDIDGVKASMQFSVTLMPKRQVGPTTIVEIFSIGPMGGNPLPDNLVKRILPMVFPDGVSYTEMAPSDRAASAAAMGIKLPDGFEMNRQYCRIVTHDDA